MKKTTTIFLFLLCWLLASCNQQHKGPDTNNAPSDTLKVFSLKRGKVEKQTLLPGELLPFERVEIHSKITGYIKKLDVDIGSVVKKGQTLALIDAPEVESGYGEAIGRLQSSKSKYESSKDTYSRILEASKSKGVISSSELQRSRNQMMADSADYEAARFASSSSRQIGNYLSITAPFNGVITQRNVNEGAYVGGAGEKPILVIEDNTKLRLRVSVPEALTGVSIKDNKVRFSTKANPNQVSEALFVRRAESIDASTRTEVWEFEVKNDQHSVKPGALAQVTLSLYRDQDSFIVPFSAVVTTLERKFVIKVTKDSTRWIDVLQGLNLSDRTEIFGNLKDGDTLVAKGNEEIKFSQRVVVKFGK